MNHDDEYCAIAIPYFYENKPLIFLIFALRFNKLIAPVAITLIPGHPCI